MNSRMGKPLKIAFIDRDGVINQKPFEDGQVTNYVTDVSLFRFNPDIFEVLIRLQKKGFQFIVITNQRGIARGLMSEDDLVDIHRHMLAGFKERGIDILDIFFCPHDKGECNCRKPLPGMLLSAAEKYNINLPESILISDRMHDVEMGEKFGIGKNIYIESDKLEPLLNTAQDE